jgi:rSAM/selenodomain-associated transferase 1
MRTIFGLFAKQPLPGHVKTRLAADIGPQAACRLYEAFLADLIDRFQTTADRRFLGHCPADRASTAYFQNLSQGRYELWSQPDGSLGRRMSAFFDMTGPTAARDDRAETRVVLIGSDSPTLPRDLVDDAFAALGTSDCVIGPAVDGGYYLIGLRRWTPRLFDAIAWSSPLVLEQTVKNIAALNFSLQLLSPWYDVDSIDDVQALRGHLAALQAAGEPIIAPQTYEILRRATYGE